MTKAKDLRGTWGQALGSLALSVLFVLTLRWALFEPYVIPSGSMIPTLLIHDHILVNKFAYGLRLPFTSTWLARFGLPERGEVVVFRSVEDPEVFVIKRVIGLPGDEIRVGASGEVLVNGNALPRRVLDEIEARASLWDWPEGLAQDYLASNEFALELEGSHEHVVLRRHQGSSGEQGPFVVPGDHLFMMGDNRDNSLDSRSWGALPLDRVLGRASFIWLSCEETLPDLNQLCDPGSVRWSRVFSKVR